MICIRSGSTEQRAKSRLKRNGGGGDPPEAEANSMGVKKPQVGGCLHVEIHTHYQIEPCQDKEKKKLGGLRV